MCFPRESGFQSVPLSMEETSVEKVFVVELLWEGEPRPYFMVGMNHECPEKFSSMSEALKAAAERYENAEGLLGVHVRIHN
jgi:hypothetical protein